MALDPLEIIGGLSIGYGLGGAISDTVEPRLRNFKYEQSALYPVVPPSAGTLAAGVAQGQVDPGQAAAWALMTGYGADQFNALINIANVGPPLAAALTLLRRGVWVPDQYRTALKRAAIENQWYPGLLTLQDEWLTPEQLAVMIQRNVVDGGNILPNQPPTGNADVPPMPQVSIDPVAEAAGGGVNKERLSAMARIIGLPASPDLAARMHFRQIINEDSFNLAIKEGNTRGEWAPFLLEGFRQIPTAEQYVEAHLRGWITQAEMYAGTAKHGMSQADTDLEFQIHRRPLTPHAIKQALARGASFNPEPGEIQNPYTASVHQANLGPEWYDLAVALAGSYPSIFITSRLVTAGTVTPDTGRTWLQKSGVADEVVAALHASWTGTGTAAADKDVSSAQTKLKTRTHSSYIAEEIDDQTATAALASAGVAAAAIPNILALWAEERSLIRKQLSPTQIRKALNLGIVNPATGQPYTTQDAIGLMLARGYDQADAEVFLQE